MRQEDAPSKTSTLPCGPPVREHNYRRCFFFFCVLLCAVFVLARPVPEMGSIVIISGIRIAGRTGSAGQSITMRRNTRACAARSAAQSNSNQNTHSHTHTQKPPGPETAPLFMARELTAVAWHLPFFFFFGSSSNSAGFQ